MARTNCAPIYRFFIGNIRIFLGFSIPLFLFDFHFSFFIWNSFCNFAGADTHRSRQPLARINLLIQMSLHITFAMARTRWNGLSINIADIFHPFALGNQCNYSKINIYFNSSTDGHKGEWEAWIVEVGSHSTESISFLVSGFRLRPVEWHVCRSHVPIFSRIDETTCLVRHIDWSISLRIDAASLSIICIFYRRHTSQWQRGV